MIRAVWASPSIDDVPSFYRGWGPLCNLLKRFPDLALYHNNQFNWANTRMADVFCFARNWTEGCVAAMQMCKAQGKFVWTDYDDSFIHCPPSNPNYEQLENCHENLWKIMNLADVITVSTEALKEDFVEVHEKVFIIPNAYDDDLFGEFPDPPERTKRVLWRGSQTHDEDLIQVCDQLIRVAHSPVAKDWEFVFMGYNPLFITARLPKVRVIPPLDIMKYFATLRVLAPSIMIVPLADNKFNRAKSNIAWLEGTYAGAMTLASNLPEFRRQGVLLTEASNFGRDLAQAMYSANQDPQYVQTHWKYSADDIKTNKLILSEVNDARKAIISGGTQRSRMDRSRRPYLPVL